MTYSEIRGILGSEFRSRDGKRYRLREDLIDELTGRIFHAHPGKQRGPWVYGSRTKK